MTFQEIQRMAKGMGIKTYRMKKVDTGTKGDVRKKVNNPYAAGI